MKDYQDGIYRGAPVKKYIEMVHRANKIGTAISEGDIGYSEKLESDVRRMGSVYSEAYETGFGGEVAKIILSEGNLVKKLAYKDFARAAINVERRLLEEEADIVGERAQKAGIFSRLNGKKRKDEERSASIINYLNSIDEPSNNSQSTKEYSTHEILAEMEIFLEQHGSDPRFALEVRSVQEIQGELNSLFKTSRNRIERIKAKLAEEERQSGTDRRVQRITRLKSKINDRTNTPYRSDSSDMMRMMEESLKSVENSLNNVRIENKKTRNTSIDF